VLILRALIVAELRVRFVALRRRAAASGPGLGDRELTGRRPMRASPASRAEKHSALVQPAHIRKVRELIERRVRRRIDLRESPRENRLEPAVLDVIEKNENAGDEEGDQQKNRQHPDNIHREMSYHMSYLREPLFESELSL
jgi:hypothetical protein